MAEHVVLIGPVDHDGARYEEGSQVAMSDKVAAPLVVLGVIGEALADAPSKPEKAKSVS